MLCLGVFFGRVITNKEKKRDVRMEMFAKSMKRFNVHTPVTNVQAQIWHGRRKHATWTHKKQYVIILQALRKEQ